MQERRKRRSNRERSETTRAALIAAARQLFIEKSYAETSTPDIVDAAGVTRGALYHHFADKEALFRAVVEAESAEVAAQIERAASMELPPLEALLKGGDAFLAAMREPGRTRLLLLDGPAVLGRAAMDEIDMRNGGRTLSAGLEAAMRAGAVRPMPTDALAAILSAAYDRAALAIEIGGSRSEHQDVIAALISGLATGNDRG